MKRLDLVLFEKSFVRSRNEAKTLIADGRVLVNGKPALKASQNVGEQDVFEVQNYQYVSRGALKIADSLGEITDKIILDIGASTGGFTDLALQKKAKLVFAIDVGSNQLDNKLRNDKRVINVENMNVKTLNNLSIEHPFWPKFDIFLADLSFISLVKALPSVIKLTRSGVEGYLLIKPQFELEPSFIGKRGIVKEISYHKLAVQKVENYLRDEGFDILSISPSPIKGGDGNQEFVMRVRKI